MMRNNRKWPAINAWFCALDMCPSYVASKCDYYMNVHVTASTVKINMLDPFPSISVLSTLICTAIWLFTHLQS